MKIALLLRGFHYLPKDRFGFPMDGCRHLESLQANIIEPLRARHSLDLFLVTYPSPFLDDIIGSLKPRAVALADPKKSFQVTTYLEGVELIEKQEENYARIVCTRFDLRYLKSIDQWNIWNSEGIFFPWREYEAAWEQEHFTGDAIHVVDGPYLARFKTGLATQPSKSDLHHLYDALAPLTSNLFFIESGFYDSNTMYWNKECWNPLYRIANRVRIPVSQPSCIGNKPLNWKQKLHWKIATLILRPVAWWARVFSHPHGRKRPSAL